MVNPPQEGVESSECVEKYFRERNEIMNGLKEKALLLSSSFNEMVQTDC